MRYLHVKLNNVIQVVKIGIFSSKIMRHKFCNCLPKIIPNTYSLFYQILCLKFFYLKAFKFYSHSKCATLSCTPCSLKWHARFSYTKFDFYSCATCQLKRKFFHSWAQSLSCTRWNFKDFGWMLDSLRTIWQTCVSTWTRLVCQKINWKMRRLLTTF